MLSFVPLEVSWYVLLWGGIWYIVIILSISYICQWSKWYWAILQDSFPICLVQMSSRYWFISLCPHIWYRNSTFYFVLISIHPFFDGVLFSPHLYGWRWDVPDLLCSIWLLAMKLWLFTFVNLFCSFWAVLLVSGFHCCQTEE